MDDAPAGELSVEQDPGPADTGALPVYEEFTGTLPPVQEATRDELVDGVVSIVAVEGPVVGARLHSAYVKASGGRRVGRQIAAALNSAVSVAVRDGRLVEDDPLGEGGVKPCTYRLPDQPEVYPRALGPRRIEEVPPRELATLLAEAAGEHGSYSTDVLYRAALGRLGLVRLTTNVRGRLDAVYPLS